MATPARADIPIAPPSVPELAPWAQTIAPAARKALVIGVRGYTHARPLETPPWDAQSVASTLKDHLHFQTADVVLDPATDRDPLIKAIENFAASISPGDLALVYFSGHGFQRNGTNYIVPANAQMPLPGDERTTFIAIDWIWEKIAEKHPSAIMLVLDACRTNAYSPIDPFATLDRPGSSPAAPPVAGSPGPGPGAALASVPSASADRATGPDGFAAVPLPPPQVLIAMAAWTNQSAYSLFAGEPPSKTSIYTRHVVDRLRNDTRAVYEALGAVALRVSSDTGEKQRPMLSSFGAPSFRFLPNPHLDAFEDLLWRNAAAHADPVTQAANLRAFLQSVPAGRYEMAARARLAVLEKNAATPVFTADEGTAEAIVVGGAVRSAPYAGGGNLAFANGALKLRSIPRKLFSEIRILIGLNDPLKVLRTRSDGWAEVLSADGTRGWIDQVAATPEDRPAFSGQVRFTANDDPTAFGAAWAASPPDPALLRQPRAKVKIRVGKPAVTDASNSEPLALLRAMRLRQSLIDQGVPPQQITLDPNAAAVAPDTAEVAIFVPEIGR